MGHYDRYGNVYQNFSDSVLEENYLKYSMFLSLDQNEEVDGRLSNLEEENRVLRRKLEEMERDNKLALRMVKMLVKDGVEIEED